MDDNRFDDIIKGKVEGYKDSSFDPSALAAFHNRMATDAGWPWYVRYRTELTAATASAVVILFTWFGQQYFSGQRTEEWRDGLGTLKAQNEKLNELMREMKNAKSPTPISDTIRIIEFRESDPYLYAKLLRQIDALKISLSDSIRAASYKNGNEPLALNTTTNRQAYTGFFENQFAKYKVGAFAMPTED